MRIVVMGAGTVGRSISEMLCHFGHSVTVVDQSVERTRVINEKLDVRALTGSAAQSSVLFQAGVLDSDLCLAVTGNDEVNLIAASMAKEMGSRRSVARVYAPVFRDASTFDYQRHFGIDRLLSLEHLSAMELARGIRSPGSIAVENFARGELEVHEFEIAEKTQASNTKLRDLGLPKAVRIGSISRDGKTRIARAEDSINVGDRVTVIGTRDDIDDVKDLFQNHAPPKQGVVIAGGGETGFHLAKTLESPRFAVVLMEANRDRADFLASNLKRATVVHCDGTLRENQEEERVGSADVFVACTGDDENNIMAAVEAKDIGADKIMAIVGRPDYAAVMGKLGLDLAVSPRRVMARQVLGFLQTGPVISRSQLVGGEIGVFEIEVLPGTPATEHVLASLDLPAQCLIAAVIREDFVSVPGADDRLRVGDTVVALVEDEAIERTLKVFSVNGG